MSRAVSSLVWTGELPDPSQLRTEARTMAFAVRDSLLDVCAHDITAIWFTGSAQKSWDSPLDYVPELSDVDIHVRWTHPERWTDAIDLGRGLALHAQIEARYGAAIPEPLHMPRVQLVPVHQVEQIPSYFGVPEGMTESLYGPAPKAATGLDQVAVSREDAASLVSMADPLMLATEPSRFVELPGWHLFGALRNLNWRVSPVGPRALSALGTEYAVAWSANRTKTVGMLRDRGEYEVAAEYVGYYEHAWRYFLSGWRDTAAGRTAFAHAIRTIEVGAVIGARVGG
jgi:hypothetical protein